MGHPIALARCGREKILEKTLPLCSQGRRRDKKLKKFEPNAVLRLGTKNRKMDRDRASNTIQATLSICDLRPT